ncbi:hypothetical protein MVES1_001629 [Malassezia vespertilionis]|uniref:Uncharacterized protein n=1 Tax=Malassezia vespertilionis TaxID=2020962 RepID=A0A2N1JCQ2_9BASI|nr:uncharacterized protein MVES1_001629 [Malassezia vespertilionis]PKI84314.1 hypothetical protein MVES_001531 [Malassezia vespertilionis]WFD06284.1 hypothetical protein MVES1_001629 [Malassezia vespertilionis]
MERWAAFHTAHFQDAARRQWFAEQLSAQHCTRDELEDAYTTPAAGEDERAWQTRYGLAHLTPSAARIFDHSRRFRERRASMHAGETDELGSLRARALDAMQKRRTQQ